MNGSISVGASEGTYVLKFNGDIRVGLCGALEAFCDSMLAAAEFRGVIVDLADTIAIDSTPWLFGQVVFIGAGLKGQNSNADLPFSRCSAGVIEYGFR